RGRRSFSRRGHQVPSLGEPRPRADASGWVWRARGSMMERMEDTGSGSRRAPDGAVVGPASGARCLHRVARERDAGPEWWRSAPLDEGVRLRAMAAADRRAGLRERALRNAGPDEKIVDVVGGHWTDLPGDVPDDGDERATLDALRAGATLVWGAALPADPVAGRAGMRCTLTSVPSGGYVPVLVVNHKVVDPRRRRASSPAVVTRLLDWAPAPDPGLRLRRHPAGRGGAGARPGALGGPRPRARAVGGRSRARRTAGGGPWRSRHGTEPDR